MIKITLVVGWSWAIRLIRGDNGGEAAPPFEKLGAADGVAIIERRIGDRDGGTVAANHDHEMSGGIATRRPGYNDGLSSVGGGNHLVERKFIAPGRLEAKLGNREGDAAILQQALARRDLSCLRLDFEDIRDAVMIAVSVENFGHGRRGAGGIRPQIELLLRGILRGIKLADAYHVL